mgnify:FL=1
MNPTTLIASPAAELAGSSIKNLPVSLFGSVMGIAGLALAWRAAVQVLGAWPLIGDAIGWIAVITFIALVLAHGAKSAMHRAVVLNEFHHPVTGNFYGTVPIALLLISAVLAPHAPRLAHGVWMAGAVMAVVLSYIVVSRLLRGNLDPALAVPAWLIPGVATLDVTVTGSSLPFAWAEQTNLFALAVGSVLALVFFTIILARLVHREPLAPAMRPSLMILVAPFEVGFLAYTNFTGTVDGIAAALFFFGLFLFAVLLPMVFRSDVPFTPGWWAISFPIAALVNAALKYAAAHPSGISTTLAAVLLLFLSGALLVLAMRTLSTLLNGKLLAG